MNLLIMKNIFKQSFKDELNKLKIFQKNHAPMILEMKEQGLELAQWFLKLLKLNSQDIKLFQQKKKF